jgi:hypothetical protein
MGEMGNAYKILVGKPEGKRLLGRPRCKCEDNIRVDLGEVWCKVVYWMQLALDMDQCWALGNIVMDCWVP